MTAPRARHAVLRGSVDAAALLIDPAIVGEAAARARVLSLWTRETSVIAIDGAYLLRLAQPRHVDAQSAPGLPFVRRSGMLVAIDVDDDALRAMAGFAAGTVVLMRGGEVVVRVPASADVVDPALWLDLGGYDVVVTESLAAPPAPPRRAVEPVSQDVRKILPVGPPASPEKASAMLAALAKARARQATAPAAAARAGTTRGNTDARAIVTRIAWSFLVLSAILRSPAAALAIVLILGIGTLIGGAFVATVSRARRGASVDQALQRLARASGGAHGGTRRSTRAPRGHDIGPDEPRRESALRRFFTRLLATLQLSRLIGRSHAKYLAELLQMFEDGDLDAALRHALPLGGGDASAGLSFRPPSARDSLALTFGGVGAAYSVPLDGALMQHLRQLYRNAFERLDRDGRVDEAAFVLAELLNSNEEAVAYLERKGKLVTAAQLAESRKLPADLVVRQWLLAGDRNRAVAIARARNAFAPAVARLEKSHPETAALLRGMWGAWLADAGRYGAAVDAVWPVEALRPIAAAWLERGIEQGGPQSGRLLVQRLQWRGDREALDPLLERLEDDDDEGRDVRAAIADSLMATPVSRTVALAARAAVRAVLRDGSDMPQKTIQQLAARSGDTALHADMPARSVRGSWRDAATLLHLGIDAADTGTQAVYDVAALTEGRIAVALGESGVELLDRRGRRIARFDEPAHRLVISDQRDRAIAISGRGAVVRLARIDFAARRAAYWCDAKIHRGATSYDGAIWFASLGRELLAIDATASRFESLWHNPDFPSPIRTIARSEQQLTAAGSGNEGVDLWRYELPSLTLRERSVIPVGRLDPAQPYIAAANGALLAVTPPIAAAETEWIANIVTATLAPIALPTAADADCAPRVLSADWLIASDRTTLFVANRARATLRARITLNGASALATRVQDDTLSFADDRGRVIVLDAAQPMPVRSIRV